MIERYLAQFRPALAPVGSTALFPGGSDGCKHGNTVREQIGAAVFADTGMRVNPHLFRHIAAKLFLDANPGSYEVIRRVLGHRSIETTTAFYNRAGNGRRHPPLRRDHPQAAGDRRPAVNPLHFDPDRRGMPVVEWPAHDRQIWQAALVQGDLLEDGGDRACYATETNRKLAKNYGRWLTWLGRQGLLDEHTPPADRITPERVKAFVADMCVTTDNVAA